MNNATEQDMKQAIELLDYLNREREAIAAANDQGREDARTCMRDYIKVINKRWSATYEAAQGDDRFKDVLLFMLTDLEQLRQDTINHFYIYSKRVNLDIDTPYTKDNLIFVPEAQGKSLTKHPPAPGAPGAWDDAAKFLSDILHHPDFGWDPDQKVAIIEAFEQQRPFDPEFRKRMISVSDMVYVEDVLSMLDVVLPGNLEAYQKGGTDPVELVSRQLEKAKKMRADFQTIEHICHIDQALDEGESID